MVTLYTTAPEAYDYSYVERDETPVGLMVLSRESQPVWRVTMPEEHVEYQTGRYLSGLYGILGQEEFNYQVEHDLIVPIEE